VDHPGSSVEILRQLLVPPGEERNCVVLRKQFGLLVNVSILTAGGSVEAVRQEDPHRLTTTAIRYHGGYW
jgi:hypothetical protein